METKKATHMTHFTKTFIAAALMATVAAPALAQPAAPDTSPQCAPMNVTVYFSAEDASLTPAAMMALEAQATTKEGCEVSTIEASVVSTDGDASLSQARSAAVISALSDLGIATADTRTEINGAPQGKYISLARRVDLTLTTLPSLRAS